MRPTAPLLICALLGLSGCGSLGNDLSRTFGMTRDAPDEFLVTTRAPLSTPPNYMLVPPQPGAPRPQELSGRNAAEAILAPNASGGRSTPGQQALLAAAGPPAPANIRAQVNTQAGIDDPAPGFTDKLMFWVLPREPGVTIDATAEAQRLRENAALGQSNQGTESRLIMPKRRTIFGF